MEQQTYKLTIENIIEKWQKQKKNIIQMSHEMNNLTLRKFFHPLIRFKKLSFLASLHLYKYICTMSFCNNLRLAISLKITLSTSTKLNRTAIQ